MRHMFELCVLLSLIALSSALAQTVQLGLGMGKNFVLINRDGWSLREKGLPPIHIGLTIFPARNIGIDVRAGSDRSVGFYKGTELSLLGRFYIKDFYLAGGLIYHTVGSNGHGVGSDAIETTLYMPALGVALNPERVFNRHLVFELLYIYGLKQKVGYETVNMYFEGSRLIPVYSDINIKHVLKLSLAYYFNL